MQEIKTPFLVTPEILTEMLKEDIREYEAKPPQVLKKNFSNFIRKLTYQLISCRLTWEAPKEKIDGSKVKNILIFRYDRLGDYVVSTGAIRWLKAAMPNAKIDVITSDMNDDIVRNDPNINRTYMLKHVSGYNWDWVKSLWKWRNLDYDILLGFTYSKNTKMAIMARCIVPKAEKILPVATPRTEIYGLMFNRQSLFLKPGTPWPDKMTISVKDHIEPATKPREIDGEPYIYFKNENYDKAFKFLEKYDLCFKPNLQNILLPDELSGIDISREGTEYCIINFLGFEPSRMWSENQCAEFIKSLITLYPDLKIFVTGSPNNKAEIDYVVNAVANANCAAVVMPLRDFIVVLAGAKFLVSVDTSLVHIAAAARVPVLGLYHKDKYKLWFPYNTKFLMAVSPHLDTLNHIDNATLISAAKMLLS